MNIEEVKLKDLKPWKFNPRRMPESQKKKLKASLEEFGFVEPIVINKDNTIIGGHQRYFVAKGMGIETAPCIRLDLDERKATALNLALNKIQGEWDEFKLSEVLQTIQDDKMLALTGFEEGEVQVLLELLDVDVDYLTRDSKTEIAEEERVYEIRLLFRDRETFNELMERYKGSDNIEKTKSLLNYLEEKNAN